MIRNLFIKRFFSTNRNFINVTNNAWKKIKEIQTISGNNNGFLFSVTSGGCNGFNYDFKLITEQPKFKLKPTIVQNKDCKITIDPTCEMFLLGTTIDYEKEDFAKSIYESKFLFKPDKKIATSCGCGVSFSPIISS